MFDENCNFNEKYVNDMACDFERTQDNKINL